MSIPTTATLNLFQGSGGSLHESVFTDAEPSSACSNAPSEVHEDQQLHVHAEPFRALLLDEIRDFRPGYEMDVDVLVLITAAFSDLAHAMGSHQRERLRQHARRRKKLAKPLDALGGEAGFLLQLLD